MNGMVMSGSMQRFLNDPGAWALPHLAADWFAPGLAAATAAQVLTSPRLGRRASALLAERLGHGDPAALALRDARIAVAPSAELAQLARAAGAIVHAARVRKLLLAGDIAALEARIGPPARQAALRHDARVASARLSADLAADILADGEACLAAWIGTLPPWVAARVRLKVAPTAPPTGEPAAARAAVYAAAEAVLAAEG